jgi:hypothetical protein
MYGANKESPYFYDDEDHPSAGGVHSWVSSYADHFGYGYWDPDMYQGTSAIPNCMFSEEGCPLDRHGYGIDERYAVDTERHDGKLGQAGVAIGPNGKGYVTAGEYIKGDQVTSLKHEKDTTVMRRRTVTQGGGLSGLAHNAPGNAKQLAYAPNQQTPTQTYKKNGSNGYGSERQKNDAFGAKNAAFYGRL